MIRKAFEPYLQMFVDNNKFDRGLGVIYWPTVAWFELWSILMLILSPLRLGDALFYFINKKNNGEGVIEFVGSKNHLIVANKICLPLRTRVTFNVRHTPTASIHLSTGLLVLVAHLYARKTVLALLEVRNTPRLRRNSVRVVKMAAIAVLAAVLIGNKKVFLQYNDHSPYSVMLRLVAESLNVKTVYVQHAPVSDRFPRLEHDLNGLFGPDSVEKYTKKGLVEDKKISVITDIRFPKQKTLQGGAHDEILVCYNPVDDLGAVRDCVLTLIDRGHRVRLRPHPRDRRQLPLVPGAKISQSSNIWDDLRKAYVVIANESGVHLEAVYSGVNTFKLSTFSRSFDNYGFLKHGLIKTDYSILTDLVNDLETGVKNFNEDVIEYFIGDMSRSEEFLENFRKEIQSS